MKRYDLDERMIDFSVNVIQYLDSIPKNTAGIYFLDQITRSVSSAVLNYSEAQSAESRKDFIHKVKISLKELRETYSWLRIVAKLYKEPNGSVEKLIKENNELISILVQSVKTARYNMNNPK